MTIRILLGDCREIMKTLADNSVDSIITDPPYGLEFMGKDWDAPWKEDGTAGGKHVQIGAADGTPFRRSAGTPAFGASGNPSCLNCGGQKYGRGNPCKCDAPKFPNQAAIQMRAFQAWCEEWATECLRVLKSGGHIVSFGGTRTYHRMACAVEDAGFEIRDQLGWVFGSGFPKSRNLDGDWEGWGTALKPAWEPILLARKPLVGTVAANIKAHGVGALHIDACRIETSSRKTQNVYGAMKRGNGRDGEASAETVYEDSGATDFRAKPGARRGDAGSAARFFYCAKASAEDRHIGALLASKGNKHPTVKPTDLMRWLVRMVTPPGGTVLDPFLGSGSTLRAADIEGFDGIGIEKNADYVAIARERIAGDAPLFAETAA